MHIIVGKEVATNAIQMSFGSSISRTAGRWRVRRIKFSRRAVAIWPIGVAVLVSAFWWAPVLSHEVRSMFWRAECLSYSPPKDQVVYEEDPAAVAALIGQPGYETAEGSRLCWIPECWRELMPVELQSQGTVFLHERISRSGHLRLVAVDVNVQPGSRTTTTGDTEDISFQQTIIVPGTGLSSNHVLSVGQTIVWICPADPKPMRFYAGYADPADPARFSFDYQRDGVRATIDGVLNDEDCVTLTPRRGTLSHAMEPLLWEPDGKATPAAVN